MRTGYTHITLVLDRSGSMQACKQGTIKSFNEFFAEQKKVPGHATVTMVQFDDNYEIIHNMEDIQTIPNLTDTTFVPRGSTALLDAIGKGIVTLGEKLNSMSEKDRPEKVLFVILTDGDENSSIEYTKERIAEMVKHQTNTYSWTFVYLGANQDAILVGTALGFERGNIANYVSTNEGARDAVLCMNVSATNYRKGADRATKQFFAGAQ